MDIHTLPAMRAIESNRLYGLERARQPRRHAALEQCIEFSCPYCGEQTDSTFDETAASVALIEDCRVCCQPVQITFHTDRSGGLARVVAKRLDD